MRSSSQFALPTSRAFDGVPSHPADRSWLLRLLAVLCVAPVALALMPPTANAAVSTEQALLSAVNATRAAHDLRPLVLNTELRSAARRHSATMIARNRLYHSDLSDISGRWVAENVALGPSVEAVHAALMASPLHRGNLLDRGMTQIGVAVDYDSASGSLWVTQIFRQPR